MRLSRFRSALIAIVAFVALVFVYWLQQPLIISPFGVTIVANQGTTLALAAMAQMVVVLTGGVDLSVGAIIGLSNCIAATYMGQTPESVALVVVLTLAAGALAGAINGVIVAYGRIQPIIVTLATLSVFGGFALIVRPQPGGSVPAFFASSLTGNWGYLPFALIFLLLVVVLVWMPFMGSRIGRTIYAIGDNEGAAFMSGLKVRRTKILAYAASGFLAACAGLFLTAQTTSGDATVGPLYTLSSVASVVFGGVALAGGRGIVVGPIFAAYFLSVITSVLFAAGISPFYQSVFQGGILILVLAFGSFRALTARNWLQVIRT